MNTDPVNPVYKPSHYQLESGQEAIDLIAEQLREAFGPNGFKAFCLGNAMKYAARIGRKGSQEQDLGKIGMYMYWMVHDPAKPSENRLKESN